ncbi:unnamed protein product [Urochloa humidicola]
MLHMALLRKHRSSTVCTRTELESREKLDEAWDCILLHENSVNSRIRERSNIFGRKELDSSVNKQDIEVRESTNYPTNAVCEVVNHATGPKDDIFGDLPLLELESSKTMFRTGVGELPTVIEESFITSPSEADSISEAVPLRLIDASDITAQTPSPLDDLVQSEGSPRNEPTFICHNDVAGSHRSAVEVNGLPHHKNISVMEPGPGNMQLELNGPTLSSHSTLRSNCGFSNPLQGCFDANKNCSQEIKRHGTSSTTSSPAINTRTEATKYKDALVKGKKSTDIISAVVALPAHTNNLSSQFSRSVSAVSQGVFSIRTDANDMSSFRSMPAKECIPSTRPSGMVAKECIPSTRPPGMVAKECIPSTRSSGMLAKECIPSTRPSVMPAKECIPPARPSSNFRSNVDPCVSLSTDNQGSWHSKVHPICSPANVGMAFMKLPGLERMEISNCNVGIGENKFRSSQSTNAVRFQKQQLVTGTTNLMQGQKNIGLSNSQAEKTILDGCLGQGDHLQQPTVRLMGKTVSVCNHSKDHNVPVGKVSPVNIPIEANYLSTSSRQLPQKRSFPCQDSVIPSVHLNDSSEFLARIPNNNMSGKNTSFGGLHDQRQQPKNTAASTTKDCTWSFGSRFTCQTEPTVVSTSFKTRHLELHQPPHLTSIPQNQQPRMWTPASHMNRKDHSFVASAANQCSPVPHSLVKASMKEKYQKSTLLSYDDPSSMPIRQPYQIPGEKLSSASAISFLDYRADSSLPRSSSPGLSLSLTTGLANKSVSTCRPTCTSNLTGTNGRTDAGFCDPINNRPAYTNDVSQQPAKRQLVADRQDFMPMDLNIVSHSPGWSLSDAVGPRVLDFSKRTARDVVQTVRNESTDSRASSRPLPPIETRSRAGVVAGNSVLRPGQNLNDNSKLLYPTKFSVGNGVNSVLL